MTTRSGPFALDVTAQILSVLVAVHEQGIVHRDLKSENTFLCPKVDGSYQVKILDFGICKITADERGANLTQPVSPWGPLSTCRRSRPEGTDLSIIAPTSGRRG